MKKKMLSKRANVSGIGFLSGLIKKLVENLKYYNINLNHIYERVPLNIIGKDLGSVFDDLSFINESEVAIN
jgi:hypothetical protein